MRQRLQHSRTFLSAVSSEMLRVAEMFQSILNLLAAPDPVDSWLYRTCQSHGINCTITWRRLLTALSAVLVATIVCIIFKIRRARWEVMYSASLHP